MTIKVAINGFGRIGRNVLRALYESNMRDKIQIVAVNALAGVEMDAHLLTYDSVHGKFNAEVKVIDESTLSVNGDAIRIVGNRDPRVLPWGELGVDIVFECTGKFTTRDAAKGHLDAGAKRVMISAPAKEVDATVVYGVNNEVLKADHTIISNASCTTNCLAPLVKPLNESIGIEKGLMTTIHAYTNDQCLIDSHHKDIRRARAAALSMIPTKTGAAAALGLVLPELAGKLDGFAMRVPTANVSIVDLTFHANRDTTVEEVNQLLKTASEGSLKGVLAYNTLPLVSIDFNHHPASAIFDATQTKVMGNLVKVQAWYDNEWGFSNRMLDVANLWCHL